MYADPPYRGTKGYGEFDFQAFDEWLAKVDFPVIVSEYTAPEGCVEIVSIERVSTYCATNNNLRKTERLFVQERFLDEYESRMEGGK